MISRNRSAPTAAAMSMEMNNIGKQHRHLLVLRRSADLCDRRAALAAELRCWAQPRAACAAGRRHRCQSAATVPTVVHVSIVSPLISDVRHIAMPPPRRSFETLIRRLIQDGLEPVSTKAVRGQRDSALPVTCRPRHEGTAASPPSVAGIDGSQPWDERVMQNRRALPFRGSHRFAASTGPVQRFLPSLPSTAYNK